MLVIVKSIFNKIIQYKYVAFIGYIISSLVIGELHPFTRVTMYDSFPNYAYVFYVQDENQVVYFFKHTFNRGMNAGSLAHLYSSYCNEKKYEYGYGIEKEEELNEVGNYMSHRVINEWSSYTQKPQKIFVVLKHIFYNENHILSEKDRIIGHAIFE